MKPLLESDLKSLKRVARGKVRDIYAVGDDRLLIVVSDRLSAFDVVLSDMAPKTMGTRSADKEPLSSTARGCAYAANIGPLKATGMRMRIAT